MQGGGGGGVIEGRDTDGGGEKRDKILVVGRGGCYRGTRDKMQVGGGGGGVQRRASSIFSVWRHARSDPPARNSQPAPDTPPLYAPSCPRMSA
jgi:hypothetical protein